MNILKLLIIVLVTVLFTACGAQQAATTAHGDDHSAAASANAAHGDDHGGTASTDHSHDQTSSAPYDAQFIDGMTIHHQAAVSMAKQALVESQRPEIKQLAENIITTQTTEIEQMAAWRKQWYPDLPLTNGTGGHMGDMELSSDVAIPFDQRFISAMVGHHDGAIEMAKEAQTKAEHAEIKQLAQQIIAAQEAEVKQLQTWGKAWFPK